MITQLHSNVLSMDNPTTVLTSGAPGMNDVLCGRGGGTNNHIGNVRFRQLVNGHKLRYLAATKSEKPMVAREVVAIWRNLNPPGRFLAQQKTKDGKKNVTWKEVGDKKAREKASQCLRERTPDVMPFVKQLELQLTLEEQEKATQASATSAPELIDTIENNVDESLTSTEVSRILLQQQKQAAISAHTALNAEIPPVLLNSFAVASNDVGNSGSALSSPLNQACVSPTTPLSVQHEQITKEIEFLQKEKARLQAEVDKEDKAKAQAKAEEEAKARLQEALREAKSSLGEVNHNDVQSASFGLHSFSKDSIRAKIGGRLPPAADLLDEFYTDNQEVTLSKEDYRLSVEQMMGDRAKSSARRRKNVISNDAIKMHGGNHVISNSNEYPPDPTEAMSISSGIHPDAMQPCEDTSMMNYVNGDNARQGQGSDFYESWTTLPINNINRKITSEKSDRSLSTFNTELLDTMIAETFLSDRSIKSPSTIAKGTSGAADEKKEKEHSPYMMNYSGRENNIRPSILAGVKGVSQVSMMSENTDLTSTIKDQREKLALLAKMKSDASMLTNSVLTMSDLSFAMEDMSLKKS